MKVLFPNMYWILTAFFIINGILVPPLLHTHLWLLLELCTCWHFSTFKILFSTCVTWSSQNFNWGFCSQKHRRVGIALTFGQWHFGTTPGFCIVPGGLISRSGSTPWTNTVGVGSSHVAQKQIYGLNSQFRRHFFRVPWPLKVHWGPRNHDDGTRTGFCLICFNCMSKFVETDYTRNVCYPFMTYRKSTRDQKNNLQTNNTRLHHKTTHRFLCMLSTVLPGGCCLCLDDIGPAGSIYCKQRLWLYCYEKYVSRYVNHTDIGIINMYIHTWYIHTEPVELGLIVGGICPSDI